MPMRNLLRLKSTSRKTPKREWSRGVVLRYALLQMPGILFMVLVIVLIDRWLMAISPWIALIVVLLVILKDIFLFPFIWRAYDWNRTDDHVSMIGQRGIVVRRLDPCGYVRIRGELWKAETKDRTQTVEKGRAVTVLNAKGLQLYVQADPSDQGNIRV